MKVEAIALSDFVHGDITATEGRIVRHRDGNLIDSGLAGDLERAGLLRIKTPAATAAQASASTTPGKARDDGQGQLSSASQAAPASQQTTSSSSKAGSAKTRKDAA
jgi:hypothetical protein